MLEFWLNVSIFLSWLCEKYPRSITVGIWSQGFRRFFRWGGRHGERRLSAGVSHRFPNPGSPSETLLPRKAGGNVEQCQTSVAPSLSTIYLTLHLAARSGYVERVSVVDCMVLLEPVFACWSEKASGQDVCSGRTARVNTSTKPKSFICTYTREPGPRLTPHNAYYFALRPSTYTS